MKMKRNIALIGKMHDGKSTVAGILATDHGYGTWAFAQPVKELGDKALAHVIDPHLREITGKFVPAGKSLRRPMYQFVGAYGRRYDGDVWVRQFDWRYRRGGSPRGIVIEDMRYRNEEAWAKANDFLLIRVRRPSGERIASIRRAFVMEQGREPHEWEENQFLHHESETEVDSIAWDELILNESDVPYLREQIDAIMQRRKN